jgi:hypothetical protein
LSGGTGFEVDGLPQSGHGGDYNVPHTFGSPYLAATNPYDQWPSSVVPVPSTVTVNSVESSPGASVVGEDFTPAYVHTSLPIMDGPVMSGHTSAPSLDSSKGDYQEIDAGTGSAGPASPPVVVPFADRLRSLLGSSTNGYPSNAQQSSSTYLQEPPWPVYPTNTYYQQATAL